jgi:putative peptidoglycan lipid II flippase
MVTAPPADRVLAGRQLISRPPEPADRRGARAGLLVLLVLLVAAAAVLAVSAGGGGDPRPDAAVDDGSAPVADPATFVLSSFDPQGGGAEHEDEVPLLVDGDPQTRWTTEGYDTAAFGNLKDGVGIVVDLGAPTAVSEVRLFGMNAGQDVQLRVADQQPTALDQTTVAAEVADAGTEAALTPAEPVTTRYLVVWLTGELPADGGRFRGALGEVQVLTG